jgi:hypothetical protein
MATTTTGTDLDLVTAARGEPRLDSGIDLLVVAPQTSLTALERQQALRSLRAVLRPLPLSVSVDLVVVVVVVGGGKRMPASWPDPVGMRTR